MAEVISLFRPERWVSGWEQLGGRLYLGEGPFGEDSGMVDTLLDLGPPHLSEYEHPRLRILRRQLDDTANRREVIEYLQRRRETRGW